MSQLLMNKWRKLAGVAAMLVAFFLVGTVDASAQQVTRASNVENPQSALALKIGVASCPMGTATNTQGGLASLASQVQVLRANVNSGSASLDQKFKYFYYEAILREVGEYSIAPEISLLQNLRAAAILAGSKAGNGVTTQMMVSLYNSTKVLFGMC